MEDREPQNGRVSVFSRPGSANGSINWTAETTTAVEALFRQTSLTNSDREDDFEALKAEALNRLKKKHRLHSAVLPAPVSQVPRGCSH